MKKRIAILGATGHIAKGLIYGLGLSGEYDLFLFARSTEKVKDFLDFINCNIQSKVYSFEYFNKFKYDVVINCVGVGDPEKLKNLGGLIFNLTETFDNLVLKYLETYTSTLYINFSSGAVYGTSFAFPVDEGSLTTININNITPSDFYSIAKMNTEAKHRAYVDLNIVDLRIFGYYSRFIELEAKFFLSEVITSLKNSKIFITGPGNMIRDYISFQDLVSLIKKCMQVQKINDSYDVYSLKPVTKFEILEYFKENYDLNYVINNDIIISTITGSKEHYYSNSKKSTCIDYRPQHTALENIIQESEFILQSLLHHKYIRVGG
jgi:nucleoside-diphosphate-sugar epimerase